MKLHRNTRKRIRSCVLTTDRLGRYVRSIALCLAICWVQSMLVSCGDDETVAPQATQTDNVMVYAVIPSYMVGDESEGSEIIRALFFQERINSNLNISIMSEDVYKEKEETEEEEDSASDSISYDYASSIKMVLNSVMEEKNCHAILIGPAAGEVVERFFADKQQAYSENKKDSLRQRIVVMNCDSLDAPVSTTYISLYAASFLAGTMATLFSEYAAITIPYLGHPTSDSGLAGFWHGFIREATGDDMDICDDEGWPDFSFILGDDVAEGLVSENIPLACNTLGNNERGFNNGIDTYIDLMEIKEEGVNFFYPLAGMSNNSVYLFGRRYANDVYMSSLDRDMATFTPNVAYDIHRRSSNLITTILTPWIDHERLNLKTVYTMSDDACYIRYIPAYEDNYSAMFDYYREEAMEREEKYIEARSKLRKAQLEARSDQHS